MIIPYKVINRLFITINGIITGSLSVKFLRAICEENMLESNGNPFLRRGSPKTVVKTYLYDIMIHVNINISGDNMVQIK